MFCEDGFDSAGMECDVYCAPNMMDDMGMSCNPDIGETCQFFTFAYNGRDGWKCDDGKSCINGFDSDGRACDVTCGSNGMDATGKACGDIGTICEFFTFAYNGKFG